MTDVDNPAVTLLRSRMVNLLRVGYILLLLEGGLGPSVVLSQSSLPHYQSISACDRAVLRVAEQSERTKQRSVSALDVIYDRSTDTLPSTAVEFAQTCIAKFTLEATAPHELLSWFRVALAAGNDEDAERSLDRRLNHTQSKLERAGILLRGIEAYITARPARISTAKKRIRQLDSLDDSAYVERYSAHLLLAKYYEKLQTSVDQLAEQSEILLNLIPKMNSWELHAIDVRFPYAWSFELAEWKGDRDAQEALITHAESNIQEWRNGDGRMFVSGLIRLLDLRVALYNKPFRSLTGTYWFNTNGTNHPKPGSVSLVVLLSHTCYVECTDLHETLRQFHARYNSALDMTILTATRGWTLETGLPASVPDEAQYAAKYFTEHLKIPAAVLVDSIEYQRLPDGRMIPIGSELSNRFVQSGIDAILVDREGHVQWLGTFRGQIRGLKETLQRLIPEKTEAASMPVSP
jgi:hypothetical protein